MTSSISNVVDNLPEELIKLNVNMYMIMKNVKNSKLNPKILSATLNMQMLKMIFLQLKCLFCKRNIKKSLMKT